MNKLHNKTKAEDKVPLIQKIGVGAGGFPFQNGGLAIQYLGQPIYQIVLGLNPVLFGFAMTIPRVLDALTDPIMGAISDKFRSKWGRRRPFIFVGALLMAVTYIMIWMVPRDSSQNGLFAWLVVSSILFFLSYTMFSVPLSGLTYELTPDYHERTRVMAFWGFFFNLGNLFINWYAPAATSGFFGDSLTGARWMSVIIGALVFGGIGILPAILGRERYYVVAQKKQQANNITFISAIKQISSSKPLLMVISLVLSLNFCATIAGSLAQYIVIYHVKGGDIVAGITLNALNGTGFAIIGFAAIPPISWLATRMGKRQAMFWVLALAVLGGFLKWFIFTPNMPYLLLLDSVLNGPVWVAIGVLIPAMMADLCDWDEHKYEERREGMISAVFSWITKVGLSFTFLFSGFALAISHFDSTLTMQSAETISRMRYFFVGASVLAPLLAMVFLAYYPISEKRSLEIRQDLEARRGKV